MKTRYGRKVPVLVTDGEDQGSRVNLQKSTEAAEKADVIVYSIAVSDPEFYTMMGATYHGDASVRKLARETGGRTVPVKSSDQIGTAFERIGSFRRIHVKVRGHNYTVRTRTGYYDRHDERTETKNLNQ